MLTSRHTSHTPARLSKAAILVAAVASALGLATAPALAASAAPAAAVLTGPTVHEQQALNQNIAIAANNVHSIVVNSPGLPAYNYLVNMVLDVSGIPPGAVVLCGFGPSGTGDSGWSSYGHIENDGSGPSDGNCVATGTITLTGASDHIFAWATVYSGPAGAFVSDFSMNELSVGTVDVSH